MVPEAEFDLKRTNTQKIPMRQLGDNTNQSQRQQEGPGQSDRATQYSKAARPTEWKEQKE